MSNPGRRAPEGWSDFIGDHLTLGYADSSEISGTLITVWPDHLVLEESPGHKILIPIKSLSGVVCVSCDQ